MQGTAKGAAASEQLHAELMDFGDSELVLNGLQEHALGLRFLDTQMLTSSAAAGKPLTFHSPWLPARNWP